MNGSFLRLTTAKYNVFEGFSFDSIYNIEFQKKELFFSCVMVWKWFKSRQVNSLLPTAATKFNTDTLLYSHRPQTK